jgi:hypothetical protein
MSTVEKTAPLALEKPTPWRLLRLLWHAGVFLVLFFSVASARAGDSKWSPANWVESLGEGRIDWTTAMVTASSTEASGGLDDAGLKTAARGKARSALANALMAVQVDARRCIGDLASKDQHLAALLAEMIAEAKVTDENLADGVASATVALPMLGALSQLVLPADLREVQPILPVGAPPAPSPSAEGYSGLIVDARGIDLKPALVVTFRDESGVEIFGPAFVSREFAVQKGMCRFMTDLKAARFEARIGERPLTIKALRSTGPHRTELILTRSDAAKLHSVSGNLAFLRSCRVIVVLDPPPQ